ncbi:chorismate mutase [Comamonas sp. Y33R10-2]|uniref:chorismate mutase n=1 Tax=Comamonas sp. Y33R10-2 TaxID=2853257 RepID=UPI001C5CB74B|nr:chorismate mutase [Comamonas sp. Y33R10-2]QXZ09136.1 chorismate mutase [Comamonas sp. Y33R10-2]
MNKAIDLVQPCTSMEDVRRNVNALDDVLVPLLVTRIGYMQQAARIKGDVSQVRDEDRIEAIVSRVRERTLQEGGQADVMEAVYRQLMEECIAYEHSEFARLRGTPKTHNQE